MKFYNEKKVKTIAATAATQATTVAKNEGNKKAAVAGGLGVLIGAAITVTCGRSYCKKIETTAAESNASLKKDVNVLSAGIREVDKAFDLMEKEKLHVDTSKLPDFIKARALVNEKGVTPLPAPTATVDKKKEKEDKKKKEDNKKKENNKKKGGDK